MSIENELDAYISGYHLDALSSGVPLNVDLDTTLTVVAGNLYRLFAATSPATKPPHPTPSGATSSTTTAPSTSPTTAWSARSGSAATTPTHRRRPRRHQNHNPLVGKRTLQFTFPPR